MSRIEVSKINEFVVLGPPAGTLAIAKLTMFVVLVPGDDGTITPATRQAHTYGQRITR